MMGMIPCCVIQELSNATEYIKSYSQSFMDIALNFDQIIEVFFHDI